MQNQMTKIMLAIAVAGIISACVEKKSEQGSAASPATSNYYSPHAGHKGQPATGFYMGAPPMTGRGANPEPSSSTVSARTPTSAPVASEPASSTATDAASSSATTVPTSIKEPAA